VEDMQQRKWLTVEEAVDEDGHDAVDIKIDGLLKLIEAKTSGVVDS
jgi:hypothetical protein